MQSNNLAGVLTCARYSFAPNYYKYCGPDANRKILSYLKETTADPSLTSFLSQFDVLFRYLTLIARENGFTDPFDPKVVEAYWIGNSLLATVKPKPFGEHLFYEQALKKRLESKALKWLVEKIPKNAKPHHSFHVFNIFIRTGHLIAPHTIDTMDQCRIGWGEVIEAKDKVKVKSQKLTSLDKKLVFVEAIRDLSSPIDGQVLKNLNKGELVSFHWGFVCDKITKIQAKNLEYWTNHNLKLANETI